MSHKLRRSLIILNVCMGVAALVYDARAILQLPWYSVPFIVICPLYPLLIAAHLAENQMNTWPNAFSSIPPAVYGGLALCFYPLSMLASGATWNDTAQIFWVLTYALQAVVFLPTAVSGATVTASAFTITSLIVLYTTNSYGYLAIESLPSGAKLGLLLLGFVLVGAVSGMIKHHTLFNRSKYLAQIA